MYDKKIYQINIFKWGRKVRSRNKIKEVKEANNSLKRGKAAEHDNITAEMVNNTGIRNNKFKVNY